MAATSVATTGQPKARGLDDDQAEALERGRGQDEEIGSLVREREALLGETSREEDTAVGPGRRAPGPPGAGRSGPSPPTTKTQVPAAARGAIASIATPSPMRVTWRRTVKTTGTRSGQPRRRLASDFVTDLLSASRRQCGTTVNFLPQAVDSPDHRLRELRERVDGVRAHEQVPLETGQAPLAEDSLDGPGEPLLRPVISASIVRGVHGVDEPARGDRARARRRCPAGACGNVHNVPALVIQLPRGHPPRRRR
jgi:hypothetical protein